MILQKFSAKSYYNQLLSLIERVCLENRVDDTHGLGHALKIGLQTQQALQTELEFTVDSSEYECIVLAGYLHDLDDRKYFNTQGCSNAVKILNELKVGQKDIEKIVKMIELVSFSKNGNTIDRQYPMLYYIPRYIDRVEAIGIDGLYRSYAYNKERMSDTPIFWEYTPKPRNIEQAHMMSQGRDREYMKTGVSKSVVDHFFDKLIHIKLHSEITNNFLHHLYQTKLNQMIEFIIQNAKDNYCNYENNLIKWHQSQALGSIKQ